ncbi:MAG TPA: MltA domain-containing protein [Caulobacteraceae bacterium]|nr:MltA domain-containing protein [Caulobacteraceae bacterium]
MIRPREAAETVIRRARRAVLAGLAAACAGFLPNPAAALDLADLPGWAQEDHVAALRAVQGACGVGHASELAGVCEEAAALDWLDEAGARAFLEGHFRAVPAGSDGRLTAYFMPVYEASPVRFGSFTAAVRPAPPDLPARDAAETGRARYADRAAIEARSTSTALAWMRPEDLFFMQVQGSGVLAYSDGSRVKAVFAGDNGAPFVGIAAPMRARGLLGDAETSGEAIHAWLAAHRGQEAEAIMRLDPRYVFFSLAPDDGADPFGAAAARLIPGRSVAVDPAWHAMGELLWLDGEAPALAGAFPAWRRLAVALDTGGAIKGQARADLYLGRGEAAGVEAGKVRHGLSLWRLVPLSKP